MSDVLTRILAAKRREIDQSRVHVPLEEIQRRAARASPQRGFEQALRRKIAAGGPGVVAEIKRASPSKGLIRADIDPARIAASYERNGAACLSVLTDREFFGGSSEDLRVARAACSLPVLRKDFMVDPYQVYEARSWGADCILLIVDAASDGDLRQLEDLAVGLGMDVLVESHDAAQLDRALAFKTPLIGVNNRDLKSFETRLETTLSLAGRVPGGRLLITESGIGSPEDVRRLGAAGVSAYLVGSAFMSAPDPGKELKKVFFPA
ncbi:MAG: indole-3-glycerol phosphate synthase TrpC [Usitatibacter sp.]